jgi:hypothetical protein
MQPVFATQPVNYCHKPEVDTQWEQLLEKRRETRLSFGCMRCGRGFAE